MNHKLAFYSKTAQGRALVWRGPGGGAPRGLPQCGEAEPAPERAEDHGDGVRPSVTHRAVGVGDGDMAGKAARIFKTNLNHLDWCVLCLSVQRNRFKI